MPKLILVTICVLAGALASCGSDSSGACAQLEAACARCSDIERELCLDVAEDNDQDECAILLDNPCL